MKCAADSVIKVELISPISCPVRRRRLPLYRSRSVWSLCVAAQCSPPRTHPTSRRSGSVPVELNLAEDVICCEPYPPKSVWSLVCGYVMLATSYSSNITPLGRTGFCGGFLLLCTLSTDTAAAVVAYLFSMSFHLSRFFATLIHMSLFLISFPFVSSVSHTCVNLFTGVFHEGDVAVLVAIGVGTAFPLQFHHRSFRGLAFSSSSSSSSFLLG